MRWIIALLALSACVSAQVNKDKVNGVLNGFFSLFNEDCASWVKVFSPSASFSHPKFPKGIQGTTALLEFCSTVKGASKVQEFRQDGAALLTPSGGDVLVLVPYVYATIDPSAPFINSGLEYLHLVPSNHSFLIQQVTEFFNRNAIPFQFPEKQ